MKTPAPSELEGTVLGVVWMLESCTAYAVRGVFRDSPTANWSASAGAIYPLMRRLEERGLLVSESRQQGQRPSRLYRVTRAGLSALRGWIGPPITPATVALPPDPLRARLRFLGALPRRRRADLIARILDALHHQLTELESLFVEAETQDDVYWKLAVGGGLRMARARREWLIEVATTLDIEVGAATATNPESA